MMRHNGTKVAVVAASADPYGKSRWARGWAGAILAVACAVLTVLLAASAARADFGIKAFDQQITSTPAGDAYTQAGGHPYQIKTDVYLNSHVDQPFEELFGVPAEIPDADPKDVFVDLPPGLVGDPNAVDRCTEAQLSGLVVSRFGARPDCPLSSLVGTIHLETPWKYFFLHQSGTFPVFNMVPPPGAPARFGFTVLGVPVMLTANVRNGGDFGVTVASANIPVAIPLYGMDITFWGVPADPSHDAQRCDAFLGDADQRLDD